MNKKILATAALLGLLCVVLGAFGAHGLKGKITADSLENWKTAVNYQFFHVVTLLFLTTNTNLKQKTVNILFFLFTTGIILFSGSLYVLALRKLVGLEMLTPILGPITPIGGLFLIVGWLTLFINALKPVNA